MILSGSQQCLLVLLSHLMSSPSECLTTVHVVQDGLSKWWTAERWVSVLTKHRMTSPSEIFGHSIFSIFHLNLGNAVTNLAPTTYIWWFLEIGVPPVIIHFRRVFPHKPSNYWGTSIYGHRAAAVLQHSSCPAMNPAVSLPDHRCRRRRWDETSSANAILIVMMIIVIIICVIMMRICTC